MLIWFWSLKRKVGRLAEIMKEINLSYTQCYKRKYDHVGQFWQDRFKSILISKDQNLLACGSYVELNPVRAAVVKDPKDYRWSSYRAYGYGKRDSLIDEHLIYLELSNNEVNRRKKYRELVTGRSRFKNGMKGEMQRGAIYGSGAKAGLARSKVMNKEKDVNLELLYAYSRNNKVKVLEGWFQRYLGEILLNIDDQHLSEAEHWIQKAIESDQRNRMMFHLSKDYALYAELFKRKGDRLKAQENLGKAIEIFKECGADGWVEKYEKELATL
jgi:tetratricopeptide (TPR) repeat protein